MVCLGKIGPIQLGDSCGGNSGSKSIKVNVNSTTTTNLNSSLKSLQTQKTDTSLNQNQNVSIIGNCCQPLKIAQNLKAIVIDTSKMSVSFKTQMANKLTNDISGIMDNAEKTINSLLGSESGTTLKAAVTTSLTKMNSQNKIANIISEKVSKTIANQGQNIYINCGSGTIPTPESEYDIGGDKGCYITQDFVFSQVTNNIMEAVFSDISNDEGVELAIQNVSKELEENDDKKEEVVVVKRTQGPFKINTFLGLPKNISYIIGVVLTLFLLVVLIINLVAPSEKK